LLGYENTHISTEALSSRLCDAVYGGRRGSRLFVDFENIFDKSYRGISWGIDGAGRGVTLRYRYEF